jgi:Contact-dependent growth inhibition CdiA C-terminal domain
MELRYLRVYESQSGGWVDLHPLHGEDELPDNMEACRILADNGFKIELLPCLTIKELDLREKLLSDVFGHKNPDVRINGILIGDIKTPDKKTFIKKSTITNAMNSAAIQKVAVAILNLNERQYTVQDVKKGIVGALQPNRNKSIKFVWVITKNRNLFIVDRRMVFDDSIYETLNDL